MAKSKGTRKSKPAGSAGMTPMDCSATAKKCADMKAMDRAMAARQAAEMRQARGGK